ncbi:hypothetical protein [Luteimonas sp. MC1750]|uniref:hypothetical protein n=1 Tax=Luteimonas sp. MC1750 TaxID=2799326 RepID=UPI0018F09079|nr:hypothetical protein [Luteimonas sp. MC1750]MBJ6984202.1 hypothetical protein [Luteimonas sp. MC1750]QQO07010.1 hypothetical protein JGR68_06230 [Luteimonas sp. MC1750]
MRKTIIATAILLGTTLSMPAHAQFNKLRALAGGSSEAAAPAAAAPDAAAQEALVQRFVASQSHSMQAQEAFARAFGLAEEVQLLEAERLALSSGSVNTDALQKSISVSERVQSALDARQAQQPELGEEARGHYAQGLMALLLSLNEARQLSADASSFAAGMKNLNAMQLATLGRKLGAGIWLAKESPGYVRNLYGNGKSAVTFARASKIAVPKDADSFLDMI